MGRDTAANKPGNGPHRLGASVPALDTALAGKDSPAVTEGRGHPGVVMRELRPLFSSQVAGHPSLSPFNCSDRWSSPGLGVKSPVVITEREPH